MEKTRMSSIYVGIITLIIFLIRVGADSGSFPSECSLKCNLMCIITRKPLCVSDCLKSCHPILEANFQCTNGCANFKCKIFTSGNIKKIKSVFSYFWVCENITSLMCNGRFIILQMVLSLMNACVCAQRTAASRNMLSYFYFFFFFGVIHV